MHEGYLFIDDKIFPTYLALTHQEQSRGLMNVAWPPPVMSFVYSSPQINKFWMKNTPSPLDILFCCNGEIIDICKGEPFSTSTIGMNKYSDLVIELPYGTVLSTSIKLRHKVGIVKPSPQELKKILFSLK